MVWERLVSVTIQDVVAQELVEWFEDVAGSVGSGIGARCVVLPVPKGWGRTTMLRHFVDHVNAWDGNSGVGIELAAADAPEGLVLQATWLPKVLAEAATKDTVRRALGVDTLRGLFDRSLGAIDASGLLW